MDHDDYIKGIKYEGNGVTVPFGAELPSGYRDITTDEDQKIGVRRGIKE